MFAIRNVIAISTLAVYAFGKECYWAHKKPSVATYLPDASGNSVPPSFPKLYLNDGTWETGIPPDCDEAVEIYRRPQDVENDGPCTLSKNVEVAGCFPWTPEDTGPNEKFTGLPLFDNLHGQQKELESASPDACEQYCANFKFFGLRQINGKTLCWCTSAEDMMRLDNMSDKEKEALATNVGAYCSEPCKACSGNNKALCGGKTHALIYRRQPSRNVIALDMSGSMQAEDVSGTGQVHRTFDASNCQSKKLSDNDEFCSSSFRIDWGKRVLNCVLDHQRQSQLGTSMHRIANRPIGILSTDDDYASKELYGWNDKFTNTTFYDEHGWKANGATYLWQYLYEKLKNEDPKEVNNGKLEVLVFSDGQDTDSSRFFHGKSGFINMANELAKEHSLFPRFRIVCLNGGSVGCEGYRDFAISTGGSYANFEERESEEFNEEERRRFCGTSSATFTKIDAEGVATGVKEERDKEEDGDANSWLLPVLLAAGLLLCCCLFCLLMRTKKKKSDTDLEAQYAQGPAPLAGADDGRFDLTPLAEASYDRGSTRKSAGERGDASRSIETTSPSRRKKKHKSTKTSGTRSSTLDIGQKSSSLEKSRRKKRSKSNNADIIRE